MQSDYCPLFIASEMGESNRSSNLVNSLLACEMTPRNLSHNRNAELRMLCLACQICVFFMITQIVGGCLANSLVIATGALYLFSDVCSFLISTVGVITAQLQPTDNRMFGCHRAEVCAMRFLLPLTSTLQSNYFLLQILVASTSVIVIWFVTGNLSYLALERLLKDDIKVDSKITMITAIIGLVANAL